jgi:hypothetical protein
VVLSDQFLEAARAQAVGQRPRGVCLVLLLLCEQIGHLPRAFRLVQTGNLR